MNKHVNPIHHSANQFTIYNLIISALIFTKDLMNRYFNNWIEFENWFNPTLFDEMMAVLKEKGMEQDDFSSLFG